MGAVYAIFAGFYYWIEKIVGLRYDNTLANLHFVLFFIGVNITFMPMHFLGLSGMPRRIVDIPDYFEGWNKVATLGSNISMIATLLFFYVVFDMLVYGLESKRRSGYTLKVLTQIQLLLVLFNKKSVKALDNKKLILLTANPFLINIFFLTKIQSYFVNEDIPYNWQFGFQDPATNLMEGIIDLHHDIMFFLIGVVILVAFLMTEFVWKEIASNSSGVDFVNTLPELPMQVQHNTLLEIIWTLVPCFILLFIAIPSFSLLYAVEDLNIMESCVKIIGNQWYWTYQIPSKFFEKKFDSVMLQESDLMLQGSLRLLEVDERLKLPVETQLRLYITATDVLHSFAVPSLACKIDACPGRLNQSALWIKRKGVYYGQCSEICGIRHAFMPIVIEAVDEAEYLEWLF